MALLALRDLCLLVLLQLSIAVHLRSDSAGQARAALHAGISIGPPKPMDRHPPNASLLEDDFSYASPPGAGCKEQPEWAKKAKSDEKLSKFNVEGWNGYCQIGWSACPDAVLNEDYFYYAKSLGPDHIKDNEIIDRQYCDLNGWLEPGVRDIVGNFTALQAKGQEYCQKKFIQKFSGKKTLKSDPLKDMMFEALKEKALKKALGFLNPFKIFGIIKDIKEAVELATDPKGALGDFAMDKKIAHMIGAHYCALGDVSCEIAYCNYAFCKHADGTLGTMKECEGWNDGKGMSAR